MPALQAGSHGVRTRVHRDSDASAAAGRAVVAQQLKPAPLSHRPCAGAGKSLCYQLPALVGGGTVLVVSPLLALMRDQLAHLPPTVPAAMLWGAQRRHEQTAVLQALSVRAQRHKQRAYGFCT